MDKATVLLENWLEALLEQLPEACLLFDSTYHSYLANHKYQELNTKSWQNCSLQEIAAQWFFSLPADLEHAQHLASQNTTYLFHWKPLIQPSQGKAFAYLLCFEESLAMKQAIDQGSHFLQNIIHFLPQPVFVKDNQHRFLIVNDAFCRLLGQAREDLLGKSDYDFFPKKEADVFWKKDNLVFNSNEINENEEYLTDAEGNQHFLVTRKASFDYLDGQRALVGAIVDLTRQQCLLQEVLIAKELAEDANQHKSQFLAKMSHELRTPLNSIIGFAQQLTKNKGNELSPHNILFLERIYSNSLHLLGLINEILDLSKVEAGMMPTHIQAIELVSFLKALLAHFEVQIQNKNLTLSLESSLETYKFQTDPDKLRQILNNLISNAIKFTHEGHITVRLINTKKQLSAIEVIDTGIGIPPDKQKIVFEAFRQADDSHQRSFGGTGLGLTISKHLCDLLEYELSLLSSSNQGTCFRVQLRP